MKIIGLMRANIWTRLEGFRYEAIEPLARETTDPAKRPKRRTPTGHLDRPAL